MNSPVQAATLPVWGVTKTKEQLLQAWHESRQALDNAKDAEAALRAEVVAAYPFDTEEGTQRLPLANGWELKVVKKLNYTLDDTDGKTDKALTKLENMGAEGKFIAERLVKWKPSLSIKEYRELDAKYRGIIDDVLTIKPGMPSLELVEPKA